MLITDIGLADLPGIKPSLEVQSKFLAPELAQEVGSTGEDTILDLIKITDKNEGAADIWSIGKLALFLLKGLTDCNNLDDLNLDPGWSDFLSKSLVKDPEQRYPGKNLLKCKLFQSQYQP